MLIYRGWKAAPTIYILILFKVLEKIFYRKNRVDSCPDEHYIGIKIEVTI